MKASQIFCQAFEVIDQISFSRTDKAVPGPVLYLPEVVAFEPTGDHTAADLLQTLDAGILAFELTQEALQQVVQTVFAADTDKESTSVCGVKMRNLGD